MNYPERFRKIVNALRPRMGKNRMVALRSSCVIGMKITVLPKGSDPYSGNFTFVIGKLIWQESPQMGGR